jgi:hypothetical protein
MVSFETIVMQSSMIAAWLELPGVPHAFGHQHYHGHRAAIHGKRLGA